MAKIKRATKKKKRQTTREVADILQHMMDSAQKELGPGNMYAASEHEQHHIGLPLPALALEYAFGSNVLYLGAIYGIAGPPKSFKSTLALEFGRIVASLGGINAMCETEGGKISAVTINSIFGSLAKRMLLRLENNIEAAQAYLLWAIEWFRKQFPNRDQLFGLFLDSFTGSGSEERHKEIIKAGHAGRGFPIEALLWSKWLQDQASRFIGWPAIFVFVNHEKSDINDPRRKRHPGGDAQEFYATTYMRAVRVKTNEGVEQIIHHINLGIVRHSFGMEGRRIDIPLVIDKQSRKWAFDWDYATAHLLTHEKTPSNVKDVLHVTTTTQSVTAFTRRFSCKALGCTDVTGRELGRAIHSDKSIMNSLREVLMIARHKVWSGIMPVHVGAASAEVAAPLSNGDVEDSLTSEEAQHELKNMQTKTDTRDDLELRA